MKLPKIEKITNNLVAKIVCLAIALLIYTLHQNKLVSKKSIDVPLAVISDGTVVPIGEIPQTVKVKIKSTENVLPAITEEDITAKLDLTAYTKTGTVKIPVSVILSKELIQSVETKEVSVNPEFVSLALDKKHEKYIPVSPSIIGEPETGYSLGNFSVEPKLVRAVGAASILEATEKIYTDPIDISGLQDSGEISVRLKNDNPLLSLEKDTEVLVKYEINTMPVVKSYENVAVKFLNLDKKFTIAAEVPKVSFKLSGNRRVMSRYAISDNEVFVECQEITEPGQYSLPLHFFPPLGVTVLDKSADNIVINVVLADQNENE